VNAVTERAAVVSIEAALEPISEEDNKNAGNEDIPQLQEAAQTAVAKGDLKLAVDGILSLVLIANAGLEQGIYNRAELAVQALQTLIPSLGNLSASTEAESAFDRERDALLDLIMTARTEFRKAKVYAAADQLRDQLISLGYSISDTPAGTTIERV
jgi:cysteinyl-tRNA synthetase